LCASLCVALSHHRRVVAILIGFLVAELPAADR
jgi:hypothetical protein